ASAMVWRRTTGERVEDMHGLLMGWSAAGADGLIEAQSSALAMRVSTSLLSPLHTACTSSLRRPRTIIGR
ncbi:hypothetical protein, partial [Hydrogenophaga sp.]|uniref:hypothetical protein n=1 Tax=Hydrogenophaga sp. TaxID=1904254 RepID=UPI0027313147